MTMVKAYSDLPIGLASTSTVQGCFATVDGQHKGMNWQRKWLQTLFSAAFAPENID